MTFSNYPQGSFNREFEAKIFAIAVGYETNGFGDYKGMVEFQNNIIGGKYGNINQAISSQMVDSPVFIMDYFFHANFYGEFNKKHNIGNVNYRVPTTAIPFSLINVIKSTY